MRHIAEKLPAAVDAARSRQRHHARVMTSPMPGVLGSTVFDPFLGLAANSAGSARRKWCIGTAVSGSIHFAACTASSRSLVKVPPMGRVVLVVVGQKDDVSPGEPVLRQTVDLVGPLGELDATRVLREVGAQVSRVDADDHFRSARFTAARAGAVPAARPSASRGRGRGGHARLAVANSAVSRSATSCTRGMSYAERTQTS